MTQSSAALSDTHAIVAPLLAPGTEILAAAYVDLGIVNTGGTLGLFSGLRDPVKECQVALTTAGIVFVGSNLGFTGPAHYAVDAIPWAAIREVVEPNQLVQKKFLNFVLARGAIRLAFFDSSQVVPPAVQQHFYAQGATIARQLQGAAGGGLQADAIVHSLQRATVDQAGATHEDFLRLLVGAWLPAGETIEQMGLALTNDAESLVALVDAPAEMPTLCFCVGTTQRLFFVRTARSIDGVSARRICLGVAAIPLAQIHLAPGAPTSFALDTATTVTLDLSAPHPDMPSDAAFRASFPGWLASRASSAAPPAAPGAGPTRRLAEQRAIQPWARALSTYAERLEAKRQAKASGKGGFTLSTLATLVSILVGLVGALVALGGLARVLMVATFDHDPDATFRVVTGGGVAIAALPFFLQAVVRPIARRRVAAGAGATFAWLGGAGAFVVLSCLIGVVAAVCAHLGGP